MRAAAITIAGMLMLVGSSRGGGPAAGGGAAPGGAGIEGTWRGAIVLQPAEVEFDMVLEVGRQADGKWVASIDLPVQGLRHRPVDAMVVNGRELSFRLHDSTGATAFKGTLSEDGRTIRGLVSEQGQPSAGFVLERVAARPAREEAGEDRPVHALHPLASSAAELAARFNEDVDKVRLILLLSPT
ncbi:MAG TPA: hypothetical protein VHQ90_14370 [Thermoanaerobaculia bacterium]|nr:hypothetical protein [Thermoanaerobaculia bacterium]